MRRVFGSALLFWFILCVPAQEKIADGDYWGQLIAAEEIGDSIFPRKNIYTKEEIRDGKLTEIYRETREYDSLGNSRTIITTFEKTIKTLEVIQIKNQFYCRENKLRWKKSKSDCSPMSVMASPDALRTEIRSRSITEGGLKLREVSMTQVFKGTSENSKEYVNEDITVINPDKSLNRRVMSGRAADVEQLEWRRVDKYEYGISIPKIVAPIK